MVPIGGPGSRADAWQSGRTSPPAQIAFDRKELFDILNLYGRMVAAGEWRDYAIGHLRDRAVFSVFRRTSEAPLYTIEKQPKLARRQGAYCVISASGHVLKRGHELAQVLKVFDRKRFRVVTG
ncbi:MAG: DUF2794 domain-containing protein [Pseudomonadota bacterium]